MIPRQSTTLHHFPMVPNDALELAPLIKGDDALECSLFGISVLDALRAGNASGVALTAWREERILGCFGATEAQSIWSLWRDDLTPVEQLSILRLTPKYVSMLQDEVPGVLSNWVLQMNSRARRWLEASRCFDFGNVVIHAGHGFIPFQTKPRT